MAKFTLIATDKFFDIVTGDPYQPGDEVHVDSEERARNMINGGLARLLQIKADKEIKKSGKKVIVYQNLLYWIGGIETADYNLAQTFCHNNITFVFREADINQAIRIGKWCDVYMDQGNESYFADVLLVENYDAYQFIKGRVKAKKIYQHIHADWGNMKKMEIWKNFDWKPDKDIDKIISVSETSAKGLCTAFEKPIKSTVVSNIVCPDLSNHKLFLTLSRFTAEKGADLIVKMVSEFNKANMPFTWIITATELNFEVYARLKNDPSVLFVKPGVNNRSLIKHADYLVQLSKNESFCYSAHEALMEGVPVISTAIPEIEKIIVPGKNGYLVGQNLEGLDIDAIFNRKPQFKPEEFEVDPLWEAVLRGEL